MPPSPKRTYSRFATHAATLLGKQVKLARKERKWTEKELAERAGISRGTLQKIEKGDLGCEIGLVFEVAVLVGIKLFEAEQPSVATNIKHTDDKLALLPKQIRKVKKAVDDDF